MNFRQWLESSTHLNFYDGPHPLAYLIDNRGRSHKVESGSTHVKLASKLTGKPIVPTEDRMWVSEPLSALMKEGWIRVYGNNFHVAFMEPNTKGRIASFLLELFGPKVFGCHDAISIEVGRKAIDSGQKDLFLISNFVEENS